MIVIEGKGGKSKIIENFIRKKFMTSSILILDYVGVNSWAGAEWVDVREIERKDNYRDVISEFKNNHETISKYDWIVFYINTNKEAIDSFKQLDREYQQNFIVTIQSYNGITNKYFI